MNWPDEQEVNEMGMVQNDVDSGDLCSLGLNLLAKANTLSEIINKEILIG